MELIQKNNHQYYQFSLFQKFLWLLAIVTTRDANLSFAVNDDEQTVVKNRRLLADDWQFDLKRLVTADQVHGRTATDLSRKNSAHEQPDFSCQIEATDGLITQNTHQPLMILTADCAPVFILDPVHRVISLLHVGWRGALKNIVRVALEKMIHTYQSNPTDLVVGIGPCLRVGDYQVQPDFVLSFKKTYPQVYDDFFIKKNTSIYFDLEKVIAHQLAQMNVPSQQIEFSNISTASNLEYFYSYRAEKGQTGRFGSLMMLSDTFL